MTKYTILNTGLNGRFIKENGKIIELDKVVDLLNENEELKKQLDYIQNAISNAIKHQKTEIGQKALQKIIEDYNEYMLNHKEV